MVRGWRMLSEKERQHLVENECWRSSVAFQRTIDRQAEFGRNCCVVACKVCMDIAYKLGFKPVGGWKRKNV